MAVRTITTKLALTGEAEYRAKIKNLNADLALHKSELEKIQAEYKDSANSMAALGAKYSVMEAQLSTLNQKHAEQLEMLKKAEDAYDKYVKEAAALKERQEELRNSSSASAEEEKKLAEQIAKAEENMQRAANSVTSYQKELNRTERDQANLGAELAKTKKYWAEAQESADGCAHSIDQYGKEVKEAESVSAEYQSKIKSLNAELVLHKSEFEKIQAQYKNQANTTEALNAKYSAIEKQLSTLNEKHKEQAGMLEKAQTAYQKYAQEVDSLEEKQKELQNSTEGSAEAEKQLQAELNAAKKNMDEAAKSITSYQTELNVTERDQANLGAELERTKTYLDEASASADGCATSIDQYGKEVKQAAEETKDLEDKGAASINALAQAIVAAGIAEKVEEVTAALLDCVDTFAAFEAQMSTVQAVSGATGEEMEALTEKAKAMGASTSFTATEAGQALEYMAMAGWKTGDMLDGLEGIMNLAAASGESLASTSDIVTDALTAFNLKASDSGRFADVLAAASSNANTNVGLMGETFKYAAPVAGALGYSIEDVALAVGLMANAGIKGSSAGTALRGTLTNLSKPSNEVAGYMKKLGISLTDSQGKMRSLSGLMDILRDRFEDLTEAEKAEYAAGIAGKEAIDLAETATLGVAEGLASSGGKAVKEADKLASEVYNRNKTWLDKQTKYQKLTLREQLEAWKAIQSQFIRESKQYADAEEKIFDLKAKMQDEYLKKVEEVNKKITSLEKEYQDALASRTKEIFNSYKLFDKAADLEEVSGRDLIGNLQSQVKRMEDFYAGLQELSARGVGDALVEEIRAMGPSAMAQLDALLELSDLKLTEYADLYKRKQRLATQQAIEELKPLREETNRQIQASMDEMSAVYAQLAPAVGTAFTDAVAAGITSGSPAMASAADAAARQAVAAAEQAVAGTVKTIGGVSYDLRVDYSSLMAAAKSYEEFAALAAQRNAKIIGENIDLVGKGFSDNSQLLAQWRENMARAEEESNKAISSMAEGISGEIQSVGSLVQDMRSCVEAESQAVQNLIEQSISRLADNI